jgi:hypothetical protein
VQEYQYHAEQITYREIAESFGWKRDDGEPISHRTVRRYKQLWIADGCPTFGVTSIVQKPPSLFDHSIGEALRLSGDWMIVGDVHAPTTDFEFAMRVVDVGERLGIKRLLIGGDMLNNDVFSRHPKTSEGIQFKDEAAAARALLLCWLEWFDEIVWTAGNHERRFEKWVNGAKGIESLKRDILLDNRIITSRFGYCSIDTPRGIWRVTHPKNYSRIPLRTVNALSAKHNCHVWGFHEHHLGITWNHAGRHLVVNGGGLFDADMLEYVALDDSTMPRMAKGFGALLDGFPYLYGDEPFTNWERVLAQPVERKATKKRRERAA